MTNTTANSTDTVIIYHKVKQDVNCLDDIAAAWVTFKALSPITVAINYIKLNRNITMQVVLN